MADKRYNSIAITTLLILPILIFVSISYPSLSLSLLPLELLSILIGIFFLKFHTNERKIELLALLIFLTGVLLKGILENSEDAMVSSLLILCSIVMFSILRIEKSFLNYSLYLLNINLLISIFYDIPEIVFFFIITLTCACFLITTRINKTESEEMGQKGVWLLSSLLLCTIIFVNTRDIIGNIESLILTSLTGTLIILILEVVKWD